MHTFLIFFGLLVMAVGNYVLDGSVATVAKVAGGAIAIGGAVWSIVLKRRAKQVQGA